MSDNIPFHIQMEIIKKVSNVKSLIRFRPVSKPWKSFIDSSEFIKGYDARHTHPHSLILSYKPGIQDQDELRHICFVDDDIETFMVQKQELALVVIVSSLLKQYHVSKAVGECHGLLCLFCYSKDHLKRMVVIWNPSIEKYFGIALLSFYSQSQAYTQHQLFFGFRVCRVTRDPTIVKIIYAVNMLWHVEVFTLSSGVWNVIPSGNLPRRPIQPNSSTNVEFKVVDLSDNLTNELFLRVSFSKLRGSLVVLGFIKVDEALCYGVWVMENDSSFRKLFTIGAPANKILGFRKNGEPIFENEKESSPFTTLDVYDPCSQQMKNLRISRVVRSFFMGSYKESLLFLDHLDSHIYYDNIDQNDDDRISRGLFFKCITTSWQLVQGIIHQSLQQEDMLNGNHVSCDDQMVMPYDSLVVLECTIVETLLNISPENKAHYDSEKKAIHLLLTGIRDKINSTVDACKTAHEIWIAIERLQQGESLNIQDVKTNLFWEFGRFTYHDGESMESYYSRFYKMMNEMIRNNLEVATVQVNVQFLQQLQPKWSRFVTIVKQTHDLDTIKGKEIAKPITPPSKSASEDDSDPEQA
ncbi:probable galacturonosyltransferase 7 isoform X2 [Tanacetum coccineum]